LVAFLDAGAPPVYVGFGSVRAPRDAARVAIEAIRAQGRRALVGRGWADLALIDDRDDCFAVGEVNQQALFGRVAAVVHHGGAVAVSDLHEGGTGGGRQPADDRSRRAGRRPLPGPRLADLLRRRAGRGAALAPALGADTDEVLTGLGLDPGEIARLRDERVVA
jgi:hypothetical protein